MIAGNKLIVADYTNHRVLIWNSLPATNGAPADYVIGQPNLTSCGVNTGGVGAGTLKYPGDVWTDGTKLMVADSGNNRLLIWNSFPTTSGAPADLVLGQTTMTGTAPDLGGAVSAAGVSSASTSWSNVSSNGLQIFYSDCDNNRILIWNTIPTTNGAPAEVVLGQPDFTSSGAASPPTANSLNYVGGVTIHGNQFFITDYNNSRVLIYNSN